MQVFGSLFPNIFFLPCVWILLRSSPIPNFRLKQVWYPYYILGDKTWVCNPHLPLHRSRWRNKIIRTMEAGKNFGAGKVFLFDVRNLQMCSVVNLLPVSKNITTGKFINTLYKTRLGWCMPKPLTGPSQVVEYLGQVHAQVAISNHRLRSLMKWCSISLPGFTEIILPKRWRFHGSQFFAEVLSTYSSFRLCTYQALWVAVYFQTSFATTASACFGIKVPLVKKKQGLRNNLSWHLNYNPDYTSSLRKRYYGYYREK